MEILAFTLKAADLAAVSGPFFGLPLLSPCPLLREHVTGNLSGLEARRVEAIDGADDDDLNRDGGQTQYSG